MSKKRKTDPDKLLIATEFFKSRIDQLGDWCVGDIRRCCRLKDDGTYETNGAMVGAFILWVCSIDYLGGLLTNSHLDSRKRITSFLEGYINKARGDTRKYNSKDILDLRDGLVHSYSPNCILLSGADRRLHLARLGDQTFLILEEVVEDTEKAFDLFKKDLLSNNGMILTAYDYYNKYLPIGPLKMEYTIAQK
jgi:hypothetical protein